MINDYKKTISACYIGYVVQAIACTISTLLFVNFHDEYSIPMSKITLLITINYFLQFFIDLVSAKFASKVSYRTLAFLSHLFVTIGLILLTILPDMLPSAFSGLLISTVIFAVGGGLLEVIISPMVEACPIKNKEQTMSMLHSFFCWGQVVVVGLSTVFFVIFGIKNWRHLVRLWAVVPFLNMIWCMFIPIYRPEGDGEGQSSFKKLFKSPIFWLFFLMMMCAGASEVSVSQWASTFAERGLKVSKTVGDLAGPLAFSVLMGISRVIFGFFGNKLKLERFMLFSAILCVASYVCIIVSQIAWIGLVGCAICGFSVGVFWPGTLSFASKEMPMGGTALFAFMALAGDLGCLSGPSIAGFVASATEDNLHLGILAVIGFPILMLMGAILMNKKKKKAE